MDWVSLMVISMPDVICAMANVLAAAYRRKRMVKIQNECQCRAIGGSRSKMYSRRPRCRVAGSAEEHCEERKGERVRCDEDEDADCGPCSIDVVLSLPSHARSVELLRNASLSPRPMEFIENSGSVRRPRQAFSARLKVLSTHAYHPSEIPPSPYRFAWSCLCACSPAQTIKPDPNLRFL